MFASTVGLCYMLKLILGDFCSKFFCGLCYCQEPRALIAVASSMRFV